MKPEGKVPTKCSNFLTVNFFQTSQAELDKRDVPFLISSKVEIFTLTEMKVDAGDDVGKNYLLCILMRDVGF